MPYSGPLSVLGQSGRAELAYFAKLNAEGGINGRKVELISLDDGYLPPKTVEQVRRLVEEDEVLLIFGSLGVPTNIVVRQYLNAKKVPHLFVPGGLDRLGRLQALPLDHGLGQQLCGGGEAIRRAHPGEAPRCQDRHSLAQ